MSLHAPRRTLLLTALVAGFTAFPSTAHGADQETAPCARLTAREVRFPAPDAGRVVFVTAADFKQNAVLITGCVRDAGGYLQEWQVTGFIGRNGFAPVGTLREGQYQSPTGSFSATEALGLANPGTTLKYHVVNPRSRWGGPGSPFYNNYVENGSPADENLWYWANEGTYAQAAVVNYNRLPDSIPVPGADYAIFFGAGNRVSAGCVSTTLETSTQVVKTLIPGDRFIMGVVSDVFMPAPPSSAVPPPPASATQNVPSATPTEVHSAPTSGTDESDFIPLGILLVAGGATAVFVFFTLRKQENSKRS
jgi:L,D-peptidoglycan transpeptidase YkuD (ErfK/YbiS/YcfS/YnhG family)